MALSSTLGFLKVGPEIKIDIYEASSHISEIGAGINVWKRTWEILRSIGLGDTLLKFLPHPPDDVSCACHIYTARNRLTSESAKALHFTFVKVISLTDFISRT